MFGFGNNKIQSVPEKTDYDRIIEIVEERYWHHEPLPEVPWITTLNFACGNNNYNDFYVFTSSIDKDTTLEEIRDKFAEYAKNARNNDDVEYVPGKGSTAFMQLADECESCIIEFENAIKERDRQKLQSVDKSR
jgi:hypothetical protein